MSEELVKYEKSGEKAVIEMTAGGALVPKNFEGLWRLSSIMASSGLVPKSLKVNGEARTETVFAALQLGFEVGLSPMQALQNICVINGYPSLWGDAMLGIVQKSGLLEVFKEWVENDSHKYPDDMTAYCLLKRKGYDEVTQSFSIADAKAAGLYGKTGPWQGYKRRMLQMRARGFALRDVFSDVIKGLRMAEEVRDYDADLVQVNGTYQTAPQPATLPSGDQSDLYRPKKLPGGNGDHVPNAGKMTEKPSIPVEKQEAPPEPPDETPTIAARFARMVAERTGDQLAEHVPGYLAHCAKVGGKSENQVKAKAVDAFGSFWDAMGKWVEAQAENDDNPLPKAVRRENWIRLKHAGYSDHVHKNRIDIERHATPEIKAEMGEKWAGLYPEIKPPKCIAVETPAPEAEPQTEDLNQYPEYSEYLQAESIDPAVASEAKGRAFGQNREPRNRDELNAVLTAINRAIDEKTLPGF